MTLKIYGIARSRALRNLWMAQELAIPYEHVQLAYGAEGSRKPEYLALNPNGHVPFIDDDGLILCESLAINLYLARKHGGKLAPATSAEDGLITMWSFWAVTEVERHAGIVMYHNHVLPLAERDPKLLAESTAALVAPLTVLNAALVKGRGYLVGGRFTVADLNVVAVLQSLRLNPEVLAGYAAIRAWYDATMARPAAKAAWALRGD
jgi:glutathione S-transferase